MRLVLDTMTGLLRGEAFLDCFQTFIEANVPFSVLVLDLDSFAQFKYDFTHAVGDDTLCRVAAILQGGVRSIDIVARYSGNEFAVMLPCTTSDEAMQMAEQLRAAISSYPWPARAITFSIGVASFSNSLDTPAEIINTALWAVREAKAVGGDCVRSA